MTYYDKAEAGRQALAMLDYFNTHGWIGGYNTSPGYNEAGNVCLVVGIARVRGRAAIYTALLDKVTALKFHGLVEYNDHPGRTWQDVRDLLGEIIEDAGLTVLLD